MNSFSNLEKNELEQAIRETRAGIEKLQRSLEQLAKAPDNNLVFPKLKESIYSLIDKLQIELNALWHEYESGSEG
ncbi:MAG: hypothetical protein DI626_00350 [Micavibrio aeruginosavorus]|uniref:Uncharacterized protein n=1 Tax=Micavibrio aeruginosavorus TaxID=349221 RepID=A0A2W5A381_9BACT|nr:MAG: hypothetical protein DI626_00350 [Micavibrio aeruginosavorus]